MLEREINRTQRDYPWPDNYYLETVPQKRKIFLDEAMNSDSSEENKLRLLLWNKRYTDSKEKVDGIDHFLKLWMDIRFVAGKKSGLFGNRQVKKYIEEMKDTFQLDLLADKPEYRDVWLKEFIHFCCFYIEICKKDKSYSTTLFGIGRLSDQNLSTKLLNDLYEKTVTLPKALEIYASQELLAEAAMQAFVLYFPEQEALCQEIFSRK